MRDEGSESFTDDSLFWSPSMVPSSHPKVFPTLFSPGPCANDTKDNLPREQGKREKDLWSAVISGPNLPTSCLFHKISTTWRGLIPPSSSKANPTALSCFLRGPRKQRDLSIEHVKIR